VRARGLLLSTLAALAVAGPFASLSSAAVAKPTIEDSPDRWTRETSATFKISSGSGTTLICRLDANASGWLECISPTTYSGLVEGRHSFQVRAVDAAGNQSTPSTFDWTIDLTPPFLPGDTTAEATSPAGAAVWFSATDNLDPTPFLDCTPAPGSTFPLGMTIVTCSAADHAGNQTPSSAFTVTVRDTTAPTLAPHPDVIREQQSREGATVTYLLPVAHDAADAAPTVQCAPASGSLFPIGETVVTCTATDSSGNRSSASRFKVIVQQGATPATPMITPNVGPLTNRTSVEFGFTVEAGATPVCRLTGPSGPGSFTPCSTTGRQSYEGLAEGAYLFTVQVTNEIGNVSQATYSWTVDLTAPGAVGRFSARAGDRWVKLTWTKPTDLDYDRVRIWRKRAGATSWKLLAERVSAVSFTDRNVANEVRYRYRIRSRDKAGNQSSAVETKARPSAVFSPQYGAIVESPPLVDWRSVRNATYYNMQLWRNGRKILSVWPLRSRYQLRSSWRFKGKSYSLTVGRYTVYVWPGFGSKAAARYGPLLGSTSFSVGAP
jgi:hypothetical protein